MVPNWYTGWYLVKVARLSPATWANRYTGTAEHALAFTRTSVPADVALMGKWDLRAALI